MLWWTCRHPHTEAHTHSHTHKYLLASSWRAIKVFICSIPSTITSPYLVHLLFSPSTLGTAIRSSGEGMLRCMPAHRDSLFLFEAWLIKQWSNRPFPSEKRSSLAGLSSTRQFSSQPTCSFRSFYFLSLLSSHYPFRQYQCRIYNAIVPFLLYGPTDQMEIKR